MHASNTNKPINFRQMTIGVREKIYLRMKELGVKQVDLSNKLDIAPQNLNGYFKGKRTLPFETIEKLCGELGLTIGSKDRVYKS